MYHLSEINVLGKNILMNNKYNLMSLFYIHLDK